MKKFYKTHIFVALLLLLNGCITKALWGDKRYDEKIDQILIGADQRYMILVSADFHYVFTDDSGVLRSILSLKNKNSLTMNTQKTYIKLHARNELDSDFAFEGYADSLVPEDLYTLEALGFKSDKNGNINVSLKLHGRRYAAKYLGQNMSTISANYVIPIYYTDSNLAKGIGKAAITPLAVTLDAVLLIGKVMVYPLSSN